MKLVQTDFDSAVVPTDFRHNHEAARGDINRWVEDKTHNKIKDLLHSGDVDAMTRLVLVNAIYFKGLWLDPFMEHGNINEQFHLADGGTKPIVLMRNTLSVQYADVNFDATPVQMLTLKYRDPNMRGPVPGGAKNAGLSFIALLPKKPDGLAGLERGLTADKLNDAIGQMKMTRTQVSLPKFKLEARYMLGDALQALGIANVFIDPVTHAADPNRADFSGMNGARDLYISEAIHQTFVDVNEEGTEAAAATAIVMRAGAVFREPDTVFRADHPFLFLIRDDATGSILFLGRLSDPPPPPAGQTNGKS